MSLCVCLSSFVCSPGAKHFLHTGGGTNILTQRRGQTFYVGGSGGYDDVNEEMDVREANFFVSEVSKLSARARIFCGPYGPEILENHICT